MTSHRISVRAATRADVPLILSLIKELAEYERLSHEVVADERRLSHWLFGDAPKAEALIGEIDGQGAGFALFFHNFSTFLAKPGIYLEDLYIRPAYRGHGCGKALLTHIARLALERGCGRYEWSVLDWNQRAIDFYQALGAKPMNDWTIMRVTGEALEKMAGEGQ